MRIHGQLWAITLGNGEKPHYILADDLEDAINGVGIQLDRRVDELVTSAEKLTGTGLIFSQRSWGEVTRRVLE